MKKKIELMLRVYRERLEKLSTPPIDYVEGVRVSAQISILETLYIYAQQEDTESADMPVQGTYSGQGKSE
ncbi:MAG: hypothetical protein WC765_07165 [Phycisphaerae bacterium]|jgi:hypothetical protein